MKKLSLGFATVLVLMATSAFALVLDGSYTFTSRSKEGQPDMAGWTGTMTIQGTEMSRTYQSADGTQKKFYTSTVQPDGTIYVLTHTKAYKPEYVGNAHRTKFSAAGSNFTMESEDGKFKETWTKK